MQNPDKAVRPAAFCGSGAAERGTVPIPDRRPKGQECFRSRSPDIGTVSFFAGTRRLSEILRKFTLPDNDLKNEKMLVHIVMWKFLDFAEGRTKEENMKILKTKLDALPAVIPQIQDARVEFNACPFSANSDAVLISRFKSAEDLQTYKGHPAHRAVSAFCKSVRESRNCVDYWE